MTMQDPTMQSTIDRAARLIEAAHALVVVTGAGMGIDSGLPDFRGKNGFWNAYPALGRQGISFTDIATPEAFHANPRLAWGFYGHRLALYRKTQPHRGFQILKSWMDEALLGGAVFTSNVDGHFQKAGFGDELLAECHGSIHHLQCLDVCCGQIWPADDFMPDVDQESSLLRNDLPRCPHCGGLARPNIYMFDDQGWLAQRTKMQTRRLAQWLQSVERLLVIEIGAGTAIATARAFTHRMVFEYHAPVIRINPDEAAIYGDPRHVSLPLGALAAVEAMDAARRNKTMV